MADEERSEPVAAAAAGPRAPANPLRAVVRLVLILGLSLGYLLFFLVYRLIVRDRQRQWRRATLCTRSWARGVCRLSGYRVHIDGPRPPAGVMLAPNHLGYVDIGVVASCTPCFYVAKEELSSWPLYGACIRTYHHVFVRRARSRSMVDTTEAIRERLTRGFSLCAFFEGTSSDGSGVLPFRPSFLQPVIDAGARVVPVASVWHPADPRVNVADEVAYWRPEHTFLPHMLRHLGLRGLEVTVRFGTPIDAAGQDRKRLAEQLRSEVLRLMAMGPAAPAVRQPPAA